MANATLGAEEIVNRLDKAVVTLLALAKATIDADNRQRLLNKAEGVQATLDAQRERFQNMKDARDVVTLAAMIDMDADPKHQEGIKLVQGYLMEYAQD